MLHIEEVQTNPLHQQCARNYAETKSPTLAARITFKCSKIVAMDREHKPEFAHGYVHTCLFLHLNYLLCLPHKIRFVLLYIH